MLLYVVRRLAAMVPLAFLVSLMVFALVLIIPGDPALTLAGEDASPERVASVRAELGLDDPVVVQYASWLGGVVRGDLGESIFSGTSVADTIAERLPVTFWLTVLALTISLLISVPLGIVAALRHGRWPDRSATVFSSLGVAMPTFWLGLLLTILLSLRLGLLPAVGYEPPSAGLGEWLRHLLLPALTLGIAASAETTRQLRTALHEVLQLDYVRTAEAKGLRRRTVIAKHAVKNALLPVITVLGFQAATLLGGSVIVEQIFGLPGLGQYAINAVLQRDIPAIQGVVVVSAVVIMSINLLVDVGYAYLNPKLRVEA